MKSADYKCEDCGFIWEVIVNSILSDFPQFLQCPQCHGNKTYRQYNKLNFDVAEGKVGNAKSKYETNVVYHPSTYGKFKGKKI